MLLKGRAPPDSDIKSTTEGAENPVGEFGFAVLAIGIVGNDQEQVKIAVLAGISTGLGAEKPDRLRFVGFGEAGDGIAEGGGSSGFTRRNDVTIRRGKLFPFVAWWLRVRHCFHLEGWSKDGCGEPSLPWVEGGRVAHAP